MYECLSHQTRPTVTAESTTCEVFVGDKGNRMMSTAAARAYSESVRSTESTVQIGTKAVSVAARMPDQDGDHWRVSKAETPAAGLPI